MEGRILVHCQQTLSEDERVPLSYDSNETDNSKYIIFTVYTFACVARLDVNIFISLYRFGIVPWVPRIKYNTLFARCVTVNVTALDCLHTSSNKDCTVCA